jgi:hypothetical protein
MQYVACQDTLPRSLSLHEPITSTSRAMLGQTIRPLTEAKDRHRSGVSNNNKIKGSKPLIEFRGLLTILFVLLPKLVIFKKNNQKSKLISGD